MLPPIQRVLRPASLLLGLSLPCVLIAALCIGQEKGQEKMEKKGGKVQPSSRVFKNIKVLKDLPSDQLIPVMHKFNTSLGVRCDYCHIVGPNHTGFEKDDKPTKEKCRQMILMTLDLNKRYKTVEKKVTCFTCHKGQAEPQNHPDKE